MSINIELKPCPFCGRGLIFFDPASGRDSGFRTICGGQPMGCRASSGWAQTPEEAAEKWNRRADLSHWLPAGEWPSSEGVYWIWHSQMEKPLRRTIRKSEDGQSFMTLITPRALLSSPEQLASDGYRFRPCEPVPEPPKDGE